TGSLPNGGWTACVERRPATRGRDQWTKKHTGVTGTCDQPARRWRAAPARTGPVTVRYLSARRATTPAREAPRSSDDARHAPFGGDLCAATTECKKRLPEKTAGFGAVRHDLPEFRR